MTCIAGMTRSDSAGTLTVFIGADSGGTRDGKIYSYENLKVFKRDGFIIGTAGHYRMTQLLRYYLSIPLRREGMGNMEYLALSFMESVRLLFKDRGYSKVETNEEWGGRALIAYRGTLYHMDSDYSIIKPMDCMAAIGSGGPFALGALKSLIPGWEGDMVKKALEIAAHFDPYTQGPFHILSQAWGPE